MTHPGAARRPDRWHEPADPVPLTRDDAAATARALTYAADSLERLPDLGNGALGAVAITAETRRWHLLAERFADSVQPRVQLDLDGQREEVATS